VLRFDLSNPASPAHVLANTWRDAYGLALAAGGTHLYSANGGHMSITDLTSGMTSNYLVMNALSGISFARGTRDYLYIAERGAHKAWKSEIPGP